VGIVKNFFNKAKNLLPSATFQVDQHVTTVDITGVHYSQAKITHKEATRRMKQYGMSAQYNIHEEKWTVKYADQTSTDESFRVAVQNIKVD
jgi:hypothetical protein